MGTPTLSAGLITSSEQTDSPKEDILKKHF